MADWISVDIDGVLSDYPNGWIAFLNSVLEKSLSNKMEAKSKIKDGVYKSLKKRYRKSIYKANMSLRNGASEIIESINRSNKKVVVSTSRPIEKKEYKNLKKITEHWLTKNGMCYDKVIKKQEITRSWKGKVKFHIEDELRHAVKLSQKGVHVKLLDNALTYPKMQNTKCKGKYNIGVKRLSVCNINELVQIIQHE